MLSARYCDQKNTAPTRAMARTSWLVPHSAPARLPIVQRTTAATASLFLLTTNSRKFDTAPQMAERAVPASTSLMLLERPPTLAMPTTAIDARNAPRNAMIPS